MSKRTVKPPTPADSEYELVQFIEDMDYSIIPSSKLQKNSEGIRAPYGPHNVFYPCIIQGKSENKETLIKMLKNLDSIYKGKQKDTSKQDCRDKEISEQLNKRTQKRKRVTEEKDSGRKEKKTAEQVDKTEKQRKKEEREKKKKEQLKKKEEQNQQRQAREEEKQLALKKNTQILLQMNEFLHSYSEPSDNEFSCSHDVPIEVEEESSDDTFPALDPFHGIDVVKKASDILSVGSSRNKIREWQTKGEKLERSSLSSPVLIHQPDPKERPKAGQKCPRSIATGPPVHDVHQPLKVQERPTTGQKCPRKQFKSDHPQTPKTCMGCLARDKELKEARSKIALLEQQLNTSLGDGKVAGSCTAGVQQIPPRPGKMSHEVASMNQHSDWLNGAWLSGHNPAPLA